MASIVGKRVRLRIPADADVVKSSAAKQSPTMTVEALRLAREQGISAFGLVRDSVLFVRVLPAIER
jgi:hypothetical protein